MFFLKGPGSSWLVPRAFGQILWHPGYSLFDRSARRPGPVFRLCVSLGAPFWQVYCKWPDPKQPQTPMQKTWTHPSYCRYLSTRQSREKLSKWGREQKTNVNKPAENSLQTPQKKWFWCSVKIVWCAYPSGSKFSCRKVSAKFHHNLHRPRVHTITFIPPNGMFVMKKIRL